MDASVAYKNALAELLQHVRFEARYEGLVTLGLENLRSVLEPISGPVISNMVRNDICVDAAALRAAGFNAYDWEIALGAAPKVAPVPKLMHVSPVPQVEPEDIPTKFQPINQVPESETLDLEPPMRVQPVGRKSKKSQ